MDYGVWSYFCKSSWSSVESYFVVIFAWEKTNWETIVIASEKFTLGFYLCGYFFVLLKKVWKSSILLVYLQYLMWIFILVSFVKFSEETLVQVYFRS
mgnify:CR=1 FL=1